MLFPVEMSYTTTVNSTNVRDITIARQEKAESSPVRERKW